MKVFHVGDVPISFLRVKQAQLSTLLEMTSFGRGRGWPNQYQSKNQILRRPGDATYDVNLVLDITEKIAKCDIHKCISPQLIQEIADLLTDMINKGTLMDMCNAIWKQAIIKECLTTKIAMVFSHNRIALIEYNNKIIRNNFLCFLQDNYMSKEKYRLEKRRIFANIILLHADIYYYMRLNNGNRLNILAEPLIEYLENILRDNSNDNIYFVTIQILRSGKDLYAACPEQLNNLMMTIRQILLQENSSQNRAMLLLMIELANNAYEIKDSKVKDFYLSNIKSLSFEYPFSQVELIVCPKTDLAYVLPKADDSQQSTEIWNDVSDQGNYSKNSNVPRAIRGSGVLDKLKKEDNVNSKLKSLKITPLRQKNNKGWDHDDRFHKDYE